MSRSPLTPEGLPRPESVAAVRSERDERLDRAQRMIERAADLDRQGRHGEARTLREIGRATQLDPFALGRDRAKLYDRPLGQKEPGCNE